MTKQYKLKPKHVSFYKSLLAKQPKEIQEYKLQKNLLSVEDYEALKKIPSDYNSWNGRKN